MYLLISICGICKDLNQRTKREKCLFGSFLNDSQDTRAVFFNKKKNPKKTARPPLSSFPIILRISVSRSVLQMGVESRDKKASSVKTY